MAIPATTSDPILPVDDNPELADEATNTEAVDESEDTSQTSESEDSGSDESEESDEADNSEEDELKEWAAKKNLPLDDPIKMAKMYRESEKALGKKGQKEGQLNKAVSAANESASIDDVQGLRNEIEALNFKINHPESSQYESAIVDLLEEKPWMASDLEGALDMVKGRSMTDAQALLDAKKTGKKEALEAAEQAGRAAQPRASATNQTGPSTRITLANVDELLAKNDHNWYMKNREKINAVLQG